MGAIEIDNVLRRHLAPSLVLLKSCQCVEASKRKPDDNGSKQTKANKAGSKQTRA